MGWRGAAESTNAAIFPVIGLLRRLLAKTRAEKVRDHVREDEVIARYVHEVENVYREIPKDPPPPIYREVERAEKVLHRGGRGA